MSRLPPKRILVGADLSAPSMAAWGHARAWAGRFGSEVRAVYAQMPPALEIPSIPQVAGGQEALADDIVEEFHRRTRGGVLEVFSGDPVITLLRLARTWKADLIVVGTHGRTGLGRWVFGSVAEALVQGSRVPVLVAREGPRTVRSVVAPVNLTAYAEEAFREAADLAAAFGATLTVRHLAARREDRARAERRFQELIAGLPREVRAACKPRALVSRGTADDIGRLGSGYDLIALAAHHRGFLRDATVGMTAQRVMRAARTPVLALPAAASGPRAGRESSQERAAS